MKTGRAGKGAVCAVPARRSKAVIASEAKQSIAPHKERMDCFVRFAPRNDGCSLPTHLRDPAARFARVVTLVSRLKKIRGRGECRMRAAPAVSCAKLCEETHTSIQVQRRQSGISCAMVLRLIARSPRRRIPFATVIGGLVVLPDPVGPTKPPPTQHQQRVPGPHDFAVRFSAVRLARLDRSQASSTRPATIRRA
jgi:hypothetical protein